MTGKVFFIPHGGGPLPLMGDDSHKGIIGMMRGMEEQAAESRALIVITAHWESEIVQLSGAINPPLLFDYYNFPPETYAYEYPAPGAPDLAQDAAKLLAAAGIESEIDVERGFDHGTFVPMMLIRPAADIPILQISVLASLDPAAHIALGRALAPLVQQDVTIIGSGLSFHNLGIVLRGHPLPSAEDEMFDAWLNDTLLDSEMPEAKREANLVNWCDAPGARVCHPREEHLMPLHVCFGAASSAGFTGKNIYREKLMGCQVSGFRWSANS